MKFNNRITYTTTYDCTDDFLKYYLENHIPKGMLLKRKGTSTSGEMENNTPMGDAVGKSVLKIERNAGGQ